MDNAKRSRGRVSRRSALWIAVCVGAVVLAGCTSEKYARYESDGTGSGYSLTETGEAILGGVAAVALCAGWVFLQLWYGHYSRTGRW